MGKKNPNCILVNFKTEILNTSRERKESDIERKENRHSSASN